MRQVWLIHKRIRYLSGMSWNAKQSKLIKKLNSPLLFRLYTRKMVPAASHAGVKFVSLNDEDCIIKVPFRRRNRNPFRSMYFAVQSMAAEMSTALPAMIHMAGYDVSIAWIVLDFEAEFPKKATGDVTFTCRQVSEIKKTIEKAANSKDAQTLQIETIGTMEDGTEVSRFVFNWSFKRRA